MAVRWSAHRRRATTSPCASRTCSSQSATSVVVTRTSVAGSVKEAHSWSGASVAMRGPSRAAIPRASCPLSTRSEIDPGHAVHDRWPWPETRRTSTASPRGKRDELLPEISSVTANGSTWCRANFQASSSSSAVRAAAGSGVDWKFPMTATPTAPELNPPAWAPITARSTPPWRPSKTWPYLSTRKL